MIKLADEKDIFGIYSCIKDAKKMLKESGGFIESSLFNA